MRYAKEVTQSEFEQIVGGIPNLEAFIRSEMSKGIDTDNPIYKDMNIFVGDVQRKQDKFIPAINKMGYSYTYIMGQIDYVNDDGPYSGILGWQQIGKFVFFGMRTNLPANYPVYLIAYISDKNKVRVYIPKKGNVIGPNKGAASINCGMKENCSVIMDDISKRICIKE